MSFVGTCSCLLPRTEYAALAQTCKACCDCGSHSDLVAFRPDVLMEKRALQCLLSIVCVLSTFCVFLSLCLCFLSFSVHACRCPSAFFSSPVFFSLSVHFISSFFWICFFFGFSGLGGHQRPEERACWISTFSWGAAV